MYVALTRVCNLLKNWEFRLFLFNFTKIKRFELPNYHNGPSFETETSNKETLPEPKPLQGL